MKVAFEDFNQGIEALKKHISSQSMMLKTISMLQKKPEFNELVKNIEIDPASNRIFNYNSYIISLYGIFERYIEELLRGYLESISKIFDTYAELPQQVKDTNIKKCSELLLSLNLQRNKDLEPEVIISALYNNVSKGEVALNCEAFIQHSSNFRSSTINEYFKSVGVKDLNKNICNYEPLKSTLEKNYDNIASVGAKELFRVIDDIADRRNEVAHGIKVINLLAPELIIQSCSFFQSYSEALLASLQDSLLAYKLHQSRAELDTITVLKNSILCCEAPNVEIDDSSNILILRKKLFPKFIIANIKEIQIDGEVFQKVSAEDKVKIGISLDSHITQGNKFYLL